MDGGSFTQIGKPALRVDGPAKLTGRALYASDEAVANPAYAYLVTSTVARGRTAAMDLDTARAVPSVFDILTHANVGAQAATPQQQSSGETTTTLERSQVWHSGQIVGIVVADTFKAVREAAFKVRMTYAEEPSSATFGSPGIQKERRHDEEHEDHTIGDADAAYAKAEVCIDAHYGTPTMHRANTSIPGEPLGSTTNAT